MGAITQASAKASSCPLQAGQSMPQSTPERHPKAGESERSKSHLGKCKKLSGVFPMQRIGRIEPFKRPVFPRESHPVSQITDWLNHHDTWHKADQQAIKLVCRMFIMSP
jgi:hypothetical protein